MQVPFQARQRFALSCQSQATFPEQSSTVQLHRPSIRRVFLDQHRLVLPLPTPQSVLTHPSDLTAVQLPCFPLPLAYHGIDAIYPMCWRRYLVSAPNTLF